MTDLFAVLSRHRDAFCRELDQARGQPSEMWAALRFARALASHLSAKEQCLLPVLRAANWSGLTTDALVEHVVAKRHLANLLSLTSDAQRLKAAAELRHMLDTPYTFHLLHLQAVLDRHCGAQQQTRLAQELTDLLEHASACRPDSGPQALLEEARLVLGSLGARRHKDREVSASQ